MVIKKLIRYALFIFLFFAGNLCFGQTVDLKGQIADARNKETLSGATILVSGTNIKTIADMDGNFKLSLPPGTYNIQVSLISYETIQKTFEITSETDVKINLNQVGTPVDTESIILKQLISQNSEIKEG